MSHPPPIVVLLTPPGRGAIASLRVEGPGATEALAAGFHPASGRPLGQYGFDEIVFGRFSDGSHPAEDVVVCRRTEHAVELHCHGGRLAAARIQEVLVRAGCRRVPWQDWAAAQENDPIAAAARIALADARTERTAAILLDQYHGALRRAVEAVGRLLEAGDAAAAKAGLETLLARAEIGRHLVQPWRVVLSGAPNVGKSSLINAILGYSRAIVHPAAGTTRDVVSATTAIEGWPLELADTAGLCQPDHALEQAAVELAREQLASAELVLLVFDASRPWSETDQELLESCPDGLVIHNKCDLVPARGWRPEGLATSALLGQGIEALLGAIASRLVPEPLPAGAAVPFTDQQIRVLEGAAADLSQGDVAAARQALARLGC